MKSLATDPLSEKPNEATTLKIISSVEKNVLQDGRELPDNIW